MEVEKNVFASVVEAMILKVGLPAVVPYTVQRIVHVVHCQYQVQ